MALKFLDAAGQIDEAKVSVAIARKADELARWRGEAVETCMAQAGKFLHSIADDEREAWIADQQDRLWAAAAAFVSGALDGLTPPRTEPYRIECTEGPGIHTFERQQIAQVRIGSLTLADRRDTFARCLAALDRSLVRISASNDILLHLQAAE